MVRIVDDQGRTVGSVSLPNLGNPHDPERAERLLAQAPAIFRSVAACLARQPVADVLAFRIPPARRRPPIRRRLG